MIICRAIEEKSLFMNARGEILPCCFVWRNDSVTLAELKNLCSKENFDDLVSSWTSTDPYYRCVNVCDTESTHISSIKNYDKQWKIFQQQKT